MKNKKILLYSGIGLTLAGLYLSGKGYKLNDIFTNMFIKNPTEFDYNNPNVHAPVDYYIENSDGVYTDNLGNINIKIWNAVKEGLKNIF